MPVNSSPDHPTEPTPLPHTDSETTPSSTSQTEPERLIVRRAPKIIPFMVAGFFVGVVIAFITVAVLGSPSDYTYGSTLAFFAAFFGLAGLTVATLIWLVLNRRSTRQVTEIYAREVSDPAEADIALSNYERTEALKNLNKNSTNQATKTEPANHTDDDTDDGESATNNPVATDADQGTKTDS